VAVHLAIHGHETPGRSLVRSGSPLTARSLKGWLYLATVIDARSRPLLGWSMTDHLRIELCLDALWAAVGTRGRQALVDGVIFHSDHGCQGGSKECSQHRLAERSVEGGRGPRLVFSRSAVANLRSVFGAGEAPRPH
jgi:transposase InsO family protein